MTVIRPNSVSGITSITAQANEINFFRSNGTLAGLQLNGVNFNTTTGVSTFNNLDVGGVLTYQDVTNVDSIGIITARGNVEIGGFIKHLGDTNTMIGFPSDDNIQFKTNNIERLRINNNGVGIGTDSPVRKLDVHGNVIIGAKAASDAELVIGRDGSGNRNAYIDLIGDNTYTDYGLRMIRKNAGSNAESQIAHRGTGNLSIVANEAADIVLSTNSVERVRINDDGRIGIGTVSPITLTQDDEYAVHLTTDIRNSNADDVYALRIDIDDDDDAVNVTGDRARGSAYFRFDGNSDQGDTSNELQLFNIYSDVNVNQDYDLVRGITADVSTHHSSGGGTISASYAFYGDNKHEDDGAITTVYGGLFYGRANGSGATGTISSLYGIRAIARHAGSNTGNTGAMIGVRGEVQIRESTATRRTAGNVYSFYADLHNDNIDTPSTVVTGKKVMYFGDVSGTTNVTGLGRIYGLYLQDATDNYLSGNLQVVGVATVATLNATTVNATNITGTISGAASQITVADESSDTNTFLVFTNGATGNQTPHTGSNLTFNSSSGALTATSFVGDITGDVTGNADTATVATNADHVKVTDNENTNETNLITFVENAQDTTGNHGLEMDGNLTYNPAYGRLGATVFQGSGAGLENLAVTAIDLDGGTATTSLANADLFLVRDDDASTLTGSDGKNRKVTFQTLSNAISASIGGVTDVAVTQEGRSAPCTLPITVTGTSTKTIGIGTLSNAFGAKYVSPNDPTVGYGSSVCDGDIWYDTSGEDGGDDDVSEIVEATKFFQNPTTMTETTTFPVSGTKNGGVFGPYTIANGVTFTINSGSTFTIL